MEVLATTNSCLQFKGNAKFDFCEIPPTSWLLHLKNWCFVSWTGSGILKKACKWKLYMLNVIKYISICFKCVIMQIKRFFKMNNIMQWNNTRNSSLILWRWSEAELNPAPHMFHCWIITKLFLWEISEKNILDVNILN